MDLLKITRDKSGSPWVVIAGNLVSLTKPEITKGFNQARHSSPAKWWIGGNDFIREYADEEFRDSEYNDFMKLFEWAQVQLMAEQIVDKRGEIKLVDGRILHEHRIFGPDARVKEIESYDFASYCFKVESRRDYYIMSDSYDDLLLQRAIILVMQDRVKNPPAKAEETEAENE